MNKKTLTIIVIILLFLISIVIYNNKFTEKQFSIPEKSWFWTNEWWFNG